MMPPLNQAASGSPQEWLAHAESDLNLAQLAKTTKGVLPEQACFHAQQAAEKSIKAVLLFKHVDFPLIHDLETLIGLLQKNTIFFPPEIHDAGSLTPYAVEARYPGHLEEITPSDVDEAIRLAELVCHWAAGILRS